MPLARSETSNYVRRLYRFLKQGHTIIFDKQRGYTGEITYPHSAGSAQIRLDFRKELLATLIHEFIHHIHPEYSESQVIKLESLIVNSLSERQVKNIIKRLAEVI